MASQSTIIQEILQAETQRLGFSLFGVSAIQPPPHYPMYEQWIDAGLHAQMAYLSDERARLRRADPAQIEPQARTLLSVAMRYFSPLAAPSGSTGEAAGRVAAYAWGEDYHFIIPERLKALIEALEQQLGLPIASHPYTDTGPILERDFAQTAGLGWIGKNTCLISPRQGSFFLLGETFLDAEIEPTEPLRTDHCGTCRRCIDACPTAAIRQDRTIDSGRCISYLTIENKGPIPETLRPKMDDWVFGCDICQVVCPWNQRFAQPQGAAALEPHPDIPRPILRNELRLSPQDFNRKFKRSPILRAKRRGYLRNISVALGNQADPASIPALAQTLQSEFEPLVRAHAAWALGQMHHPAARQALDHAIRQDPDSTVVAEARSAFD
jgi:epoxyqueuosine reductase